MVGLQEFIHKLELGEGVKWVRWTAVTLSLIALALTYDVILFRNFATEEAMDCAQLARNLAEGKGYTTSFIRPFSLYRMAQHTGGKDASLKAGRHPDLANAPLYPVMLAAYMKVMPFDYTIGEKKQYRAFSPDLLITVFNQFWFFVSLYLVYHIGKQLFSNGVGWFAAGILACSELYWRLSIHAGPTMLLMACVLGLIYALVRLDEGTREDRRPLWFVGWAAIAGLALGLGSLTRYSLLALFPAVAGFYLLYFPGRRLKLLVVTTLCFGVLVAPWLARNYQVSGKLLGIAGYAVYEDSGKFPDVSFQRQIKPDKILFDQYSIEDALKKFSTNIRPILQNDLPRMGGNWFIALFVAGLLIPSRKPGQGRARIFLLWMLVLLSITQAFGRTHLTLASPELTSENLLVLAVPLVFVFSAGLCVELIHQVPVAFPEMRVLLNVIVWAVFSLPLMLSFLPPRMPPISYPPYYPFIIQKAASVMDENELTMTDVPWAVAWYGQRPSISLTLSMADFHTVDDKYMVKALYLTEETTDARLLSRLVKGTEQVWCKLYLDILLRQFVPDGFPLRSVWTDIGIRDQLFVADFERWRRGRR